MVLSIADMLYKSLVNASIVVALPTGDPVPAGLPANTVIVRY